MPLSENDVRCALSETYASAVSARAGYPCVFQPRLADNLGIDARFEVVEEFGPTAILTSFSVVVQLKATSQNVRFDKAGRFRYEIDVKLYDRYRSVNSADLMLIILVILPGNSDRWVSLTAQALSIKGSAYWISPYGTAPTTNAETIRVSVYKKNRFTIESLRSLAKKFASGEKVKYDG